MNVPGGIPPSPIRDPRVVALRQRFGALPAPVILFNKSHSGSRLLVELLIGQGVFMGAERNASGDAAPLVLLVEYLVGTYYPDYAPLWHSPWPSELIALIEDVFSRHLAGHDPSAPWGWKLCETSYILPVLDVLFPEARYVHLLRDGRDVAFSDHVAPEQPFWRKIYFDTDRIREWRGLSLTNRAYERRPHIYNALHWINGVTVGRAYGAMLRERYYEIRYEALCRDFAGEAARLMEFLALPINRTALETLSLGVTQDAVGKYRNQPKRRQHAVLRLIEPSLFALGYDSAPSLRSRRVALYEFGLRLYHRFHRGSA